MKRWIAAALCIGLILSQTGCGQPEQQETNPSTTAETSPTETQASTTPSPEPGTVPESEEVTSPSEMIENVTCRRNYTGFSDRFLGSGYSGACSRGGKRC